MNSPQTNRGIEIQTDAGGDALFVYKMKVHEELGRLFEISLELLSKDYNLALDDLLGTSPNIALTLPSGESRIFNGYCSQFAFAGNHLNYAKYQATLVPMLWFMTRNANCRIFQKQTIPDMITTVLGDHGFSDIEDHLETTYEQWDYCVQYRESDFNFISRLMEQEGIYYFFTHEEGVHKLHLADSGSAHEATTNYETLNFIPPDATRIQTIEHVYQWGTSHAVQSGAYVLEDYDFTRPKAELSVTSQGTRTHAKSEAEVFDYPGGYAETAHGERYSLMRLQERQARHRTVHGESNALGLSAGALFTLAGHQRDDQNAEYLLTSTTLEFQNSEFETGEEGEEAAIKCSFEALDTTEVFRSACQTPVPIIAGPQTAIVVGKEGEEIWTDEYGRVIVQFHWDREGEQDENSSCWVRVSQSWAGKQWGSIQTPRIGQEVIVEFLEGDPDRPIITGRVYNADEMPPYDLPENQTQSGVKTRSTKEGTQDNFNELRFEDKIEEEHIYFHAEKDFERVVENNDVLKVGFEKADLGDQTIEIFNNQKVIIGNQDSDDGSQTITIHKNHTQTVSEGDATIEILKGNRDSTITEGDDTLTVEAGTQTTEAGTAIVLKVGDNSITIDQQGIVIKAMKVAIEGESKVEMKSALIDAKADGTMTLKGGTININ